MVLGHEVMILNAHLVNFFVKSNNDDFSDAEAVFDTVSKPNVRAITIKTIEQQHIQLMLRLRQMR